MNSFYVLQLISERRCLNICGIRQAIVDIYETGYIENVRVEQQKRHLPQQIHQNSSFTLPKNRTFLLSHFLEIKNSMMNPSKKFLDISEYDIYNATAIQRNIQAIRDKYIEKGYYLVEIDPVIEEVDPYSVSLELNIKERQKVIIRSISFTGNQSIPDKKLRRYMQTRQVGPAVLFGKGRKLQ